MTTQIHFAPTGQNQNTIRFPCGRRRHEALRAWLFQSRFHHCSPSRRRKETADKMKIALGNRPSVVNRTPVFLSGFHDARKFWRGGTPR